jgi:hypothetical protein
LFKVVQLLANIAVAIFRVNMRWLFISWQPYSIGQGVDGALNVMVLIGGVEEQATDYFLVKGMQLFKILACYSESSMFNPSCCQ